MIKPGDVLVYPSRSGIASQTYLVIAVGVISEGSVRALDHILVLNSERCRLEELDMANANLRGLASGWPATSD